MHREAKCLTGTMLQPTDGTSITQSNRNALVPKQGKRLAKLVQQLLKGNSAVVSRRITIKVWGITNPPFCVFEMNI